MTREKINGRRLVGLFLLGFLLFNFPLLCLFNQHSLIMGLPALYLYLFGVWALLILLMMVISRSTPGRPIADDHD
ncbi:hypothetical protein [Desulfosarcina ovata]|uniref:DUF3311 domain-containing protein n=2 Tax=Desulfosarcina ovata TaxID=83564 RepID=A0A5K8A4U0_9BACT|nr:hypothetical protein [Desulfosarcina ovata]BBO80049.1 hypothetical protein DSCO28_06150 [Desulfosarcina ovata subsp. sediminis]BBO87364.1 hypothetical protein DSCOOX_05440 [Desulfosarcina ovata subsp. ovata]